MLKPALIFIPDRALRTISESLRHLVGPAAQHAAKWAANPTGLDHPVGAVRGDPIVFRPYWSGLMIVQA